MPCRSCHRPVTPTFSRIPATSVANAEACGLLTIDLVDVAHLICGHCGYVSVCWSKANERN